MTVEEVAGELLKNPLTDGLTLSGGEPFAQAEECLASLAAKSVHSTMHVTITPSTLFPETVYSPLSGR